MPIYMKYDGIDGSVTAQGHEKWIELQSCQVGINRNVRTTVGAGQERESGAPNVSEIVVTKELDNATGSELKEALTGTGEKKVKIDFCSTEHQLYMQIELENTLVSSYSLSGHGGDTHGSPMESMALNFTKVTFVPTTRGEKGTKAQSPSRVGYDLALAKPF
jgi:type VI secretion system secreted protein Hcp